MHSPEQVTLELPLAGPSSRILAFGIDYGFVLLIQISIWALAILAVVSLSDPESALRPLFERLTGADGEANVPLLLAILVGAVLLLDLVLQILWFAGFEALNQGRSPGKAMLHLQVVREGGLPITAREALVRNLLRVVDFLPMSYFVGFVAIVASPRAQRLGDMVAGTLVVRHDRPAPAPPVPEEEPADGAARAAGEALEPAFRFERSQVERLGSPEVRLARQTLRRLDGLPPHQAAAALARASEVLCRRIGHDPVPPERARAFLLSLLRAVHEF